MNAPDTLTVERIMCDTGGLRALAILRMTVFRKWPYLYDGSMAYEEAYLAAFLGDAGSTLIVARIGDIFVGMATASPLAAQPAEIALPLTQAGLDIASTFYFGESVLLPEYRGLGIGHRFFDEREAVAREAGASTATFCAVVRDEGHSLKPAGTRDLAPFWRKRGYRPLDGVDGLAGPRPAGKHAPSHAILGPPTVMRPCESDGPESTTGWMPNRGTIWQPLPPEVDMDKQDMIFVDPDAPDEELAQTVADRLAMVLPAQCINGVAFNARLLQQHLDTLRGTSL